MLDATGRPRVAVMKGSQDSVSYGRLRSRYLHQVSCAGVFIRMRNKGGTAEAKPFVLCIRTKGFFIFPFSLLFP
ncbi:hypothetical protein FHS18_001954 [Paenibacillus phyllosphaerae]|uniref:Uncharacterized protein n=1 Tax=Paenibacillus phyllosphaerae TaxID=274593 RepID=A0A7W5AX69_9BACL|nr:hypothetical protein [Paenibacillus phyllosphaerae]